MLMKQISAVKTIITILFLAHVMSSCTLPLTTNPIPENDQMESFPGITPTTISVQIDALAAIQTIEGFGAASAWWAQDVGGWEDDKRSLVADLLFDQEKGIGLSFYRYNIGGGDGLNIQDTWRRAETFEISPGVYDWSRDANAMWMLRAARDRGVEHFVAFVNSPPARMTISGLSTGEKDGKSNLHPERYVEFSQYLVDVVRHLREEEGIPIAWISPLNEPQWNWSYKNGQEGCHYDPNEVLELTRVLLQTIRDNRLDVQLSMFESGEWKSSEVYLEKLASDPEVWADLPHISIHSYWSTRADKEKFMKYMNKNHPGKPLWMSEWTEMQEGRDTGMASALVMAATIHDDLTISDVTSWQYWIAVSKYQYRDGLIYVNPLDQDVIQTKRLWILGNFSRFIRPGFVRLGTSGSSETLLVSAYRSANDQRWVLVAINLSDQPVRLSLDILNGELPSQAEQIETSEQYDLQSVGSGPSQGPWSLSPLSVTTLVLDR
jgi:O-glycosyl hydrolase